MCKFGATCLGLFGPGLSDTTDEDCLFVDVFAPANATTESKLPVWFFIQGGGYAGNTDQNFNGTEVIVKSNYSMVFVQINYRVGAFGFLASEKIRQNGDLNVGLLDQRKALEWAQQYIHLVSHFLQQENWVDKRILTNDRSSEATQTTSSFMATLPAADPLSITSRPMQAATTICSSAQSQNRPSCPPTGQLPSPNSNSTSLSPTSTAPMRPMR
jgi:hypothetical protein